MELELKHLKPYLDHELKCCAMGERENDDDLESKPKVFKLNGLVNGKVSLQGVRKFILELSDTFPILKPLSDYHGKHTGREVMDMLNCSLDTVHEIWDLIDKAKSLDEITVKTYNVMCKNKLDFMGLIEQYLALDENTLK